jgi:hypothetical protein
MNDLIYIVSMPFKRKGKDTLKESEFILTMSIDLNWFSPEQARILLSDAVKDGLLRREGGEVFPLFDLSSVQIPPSFKPESMPGKKPIFDLIIDRITVTTGLDKRTIIALINKKQEELIKLVDIEVSTLLVALEQGVMVDDLMEEEYRTLVKRQPSS